jgi:hypothetical protein
VADDSHTVFTIPVALEQSLEQAPGALIALLEGFARPAAPPAGVIEAVRKREIGKVGLEVGAGTAGKPVLDASFVL